MKVKLCGFRDEESIKAAIAQKCDFLGFIFYDKSVRNISPKEARNITAQVPNNIAKVAVIVDAEFDFLQKIVDDFSPDFFQFHGLESVKYLEKARSKFPKIKIIKAFRIKEKSDLDVVNNYTDYADYFLFDSKVVGDVGGSGKSFDWNILRNFESQKEWFLSGGLNVNNIEEAINMTGAKMIDISSGIEEVKGEKSIALIKSFMTKMKRFAIYKEGCH